MVVVGDDVIVVGGGVTVGDGVAVVAAAVGFSIRSQLLLSSTQSLLSLLLSLLLMSLLHGRVLDPVYWDVQR